MFQAFSKKGAFSKGGLLAGRGALTLGTGGGLPAGFGTAAFYHDYTRQRYFGAPAPSITRASTKTVFSSSGLLSSVAAGVLALSDRGLSIEESRQNLIRNNTMAGAVAGAIGVAPAPNFWTGNLVPGGGSTGLQDVFVENGITFFTQDVTAPTPGASANAMTFDGSNTIAAVPGQVFMGSAFAKLISGSLVSAGLTVDITIRENDAGNNFLRQTLTSLTAADGTIRRFVTAPVTMGANTAFVTLGIRISYNAAFAFNLAIGLPQLGTGYTFETSPILTSAGSQIRAADVITIPSPTSYVSLAQGGAFVEWTEDVGPVGTFRRLFTLYGDGSNYVRVFIDTSNKVRADILSGGVTQAIILSPNAVVAGETYKAGVRFAANDFAAFFSPSLGADQPPDTSVTIPVGTLTVAGLGNNGGGGTQANATVKRLALWQTGPSNSELQALVA